jgi:very-short-patch-repair endonuclease
VLAPPHVYNMLYCKTKIPLARNRIIPYRRDLKEKARRLRKESTYSEVLLWLEIKNKKLLGYQFHRQVPMLDYIVDFYCHELMLVIEIDGKSHESFRAQRYDRRRQERLQEYGARFLRFDDLRIKRDIHTVVEEIKEWILAHAGNVKD